MINPIPNYNERSWSIDLIGFLKQLIYSTNRSIKEAGGEQTIRVDGGSLFPDVLLFGDRATARILQGWELKMPDTNINDPEFFKNAKIKAIALGLDSFVLWNVTYARLFIKNHSTDRFEILQEWHIPYITHRRQVKENENLWKDTARQIFLYINDLFDRGDIEGRQFIDAYSSGGVTSLIMENTSKLDDALKEAEKKDLELRSKITIWWDRYSSEYGNTNKIQILSKVIISNWIGKILFANILREKDNRASQIEKISDATTPIQALEIFRQISNNCNFWTIFSSNVIGLSLIPPKLWDQLKQFNQLLCDLRLGSVDQNQLSKMLEATVDVTVRKLSGQYPTPKILAKILASLCIKNIYTDRVLDPCCGSGTIPRAALELKILNDITSDIASKTIYASDQDSQAVQIATFALAKPDLMHQTLRVFQNDAFTLTPDSQITFRNPTNGEIFTERLGIFDAIISNLPFVSQYGRKQYRNAIDQVTTSINGQLNERADISAYLPFSLYPLLKEEGRMGIIITNAWLGTSWGDDFYKSLLNYYHLKTIITSGSGRWFRNSKVVTNILILEKKENGTNLTDDSLDFVVLKRPLEEIEDTIYTTTAQIEIGQSHDDSMTIRTISFSKIEKFRELGLGGTAQFVDCDWVLETPLKPLNNIFEIKRGERRGANALFYPRLGHNIEQNYIKPLCKSPAEFTRLTGSAVKEAFSCNKSEEELKILGHTGALEWIGKFKTPDNIKRLSRPNKLWYQMDANKLTELVMSINYGERIFVGRLVPPAFVDQRLVILNPIANVDMELAHALLNSAISYFFIEGMGFGRGLGALDLSKDRIDKFMNILDFNILSEEQIQNIKTKYRCLLDRDIMNIADELKQSDRIAFDDAILESFGLPVERQKIYENILSLVEIRLSARH